MKKAFSLIELLIVVAIIGILAAIVIPEFQTYTQQAKETTAKENTRILRQQFELYIVYEAIDDVGLLDYPENPFNGLRTYNAVLLGPMPDEATGEYGWVVHWATKTIRLDWPGTDSEGVRYYDY